MTSANSPKHTNRLIHETSPYLRQHAHNPVDWYPWGEEALARSRAEDKPIFLSIGYSACHWCHVMEHESFEDEQTAALMNELFVNIKVDREERPDLDGIYMQAVQAMTGQGGWPMSVWLTPDGSPFYGGTYFPPFERYGMPSFRRVLTSVADAYRNRRSDIEQSAGRLRTAIQRSAGATGSAEGTLDGLVADQSFKGMARDFDSINGGFGSAPKFPQPMTLSFLLRYAARSGGLDMATAAYSTGGRSSGRQALEMVAYTLRKMARGGMYDQLGGGFHRYSVDERWLAPHFEKMLYDNAQLARLLVETWQVTGDGEFRRVAEETLDYVAREMTDPSGGFYSTQDADSEGEEGKFFLWELEELDLVLGKGDARLVAAYYDVTTRGNFEGKNILHVDHDLETVAGKPGVTVDDLQAALDRSRPKLFAQREKRVKPARDDKVLAEWNGMMLRAFAYAAGVFQRDDYRQIAEANAEFLLREMIALSGRGGSVGDPPEHDEERPQQSELVTHHVSRFTPARLHRMWAPTSLTGGDPQTRLNGYLEDYANVADGLIELYQLTFELRWLEAARDLADVMIERFWDARSGGFFQTSNDHEALIARPKDFTDNATPSGNSVATDVLLKLAVLTGDDGYASLAESILLLLRESMMRFPLGFGHLLSALERYVSRPQEIVVIGDPADARTRALLGEARRRFLPNAVLAGAASDAAAAAGASDVPLLAGRVQVSGAPTAYVCENFACQLPVTEPDALARQLNRS